MARKIIKAADAPTHDGPLLRIEDLRTHFLTPNGRVKAVDGVTFSIDRGKTVGIVGESGSGKTVLSRSIMGLLPRSNVERTGTIVYDGQDISDYTQEEMRSVWGPEMAMIFQDPMTSLNPVMKIGKQITESLTFHLDMDKKEAEEVAVGLLRSVGIPEPEKRLKEYPHQLSGGMRQRVVIAIALACGPRLLFADEPTTALDVTVQSQILNLLAAQQRERFMTMILVTHDLGVVAGRADEIIVMYGGQIAEKAPAATLFAEMHHPYTEALLRSIPKLEYASHTRLSSIPGRPPSLVDPPQGCKFAARCSYADEQCVTEPPPLVEGTASGHSFRCWHPVGTPDADRNLAANQAKGIVDDDGSRLVPGEDVVLSATPVAVGAATRGAS